MFHWFGKKDKSAAPPHGLASDDPRKAVRDQALAQFRATEAALGKETIQEMKALLEKMATREKLMKQIEGVRKEVVADNLKAMLQDDKTNPPK